MRKGFITKPDLNSNYKEQDTAKKIEENHKRKTDDEEENLKGEEDDVWNVLDLYEEMSEGEMIKDVMKAQNEDELEKLIKKHLKMQLADKYLFENIKLDNFVYFFWYFVINLKFNDLQVTNLFRLFTQVHKQLECDKKCLVINLYNFNNKLNKIQLLFQLFNEQQLQEVADFFIQDFYMFYNLFIAYYQTFPEKVPLKRTLILDPRVTFLPLSSAVIVDEELKEEEGEEEEEDKENEKKKEEGDEETREFHTEEEEEKEEDEEEKTEEQKKETEKIKEEKIKKLIPLQRISELIEEAFQEMIPNIQEDLREMIAKKKNEIITKFQ